MTINERAQFRVLQRNFFHFEATLNRALTQYCAENNVRLDVIQGYIFTRNNTVKYNGLVQLEGREEYEDISIEVPIEYVMSMNLVRTVALAPILTANEIVNVQPLAPTPEVVVAEPIPTPVAPTPEVVVAEPIPTPVAPTPEPFVAPPIPASTMAESIVVDEDILTPFLNFMLNRKRNLTS